jgi:hypothetical protein
MQQLTMDQLNPLTILILTDTKSTHHLIQVRKAQLDQQDHQVTKDQRETLETKETPEIKDQQAKKDQEDTEEREEPLDQTVKTERMER